MYSGCQATEGPLLPGICDSGCPFLIPYLIVTTINILSVTLRLVPMFNVLLRYVHDQRKEWNVTLIVKVMLNHGMFIDTILYSNTDSSKNFIMSMIHLEWYCKIFHFFSLLVLMHSDFFYFRSLEDQDRSIGMGLYSFIMSLIGETFIFKSELQTERPFSGYIFCFVYLLVHNLSMYCFCFSISTSSYSIWQTVWQHLLNVERNMRI